MVLLDDSLDRRGGVRVLENSSLVDISVLMQVRSMFAVGARWFFPPNNALERERGQRLLKG
jgi:hypothetical protein